MTMPGTVVSQSTSPVSTNGFLHAVRKPSRPRETQSTDIRPVDLIERTEAMLIEGATDRQPIGRAGMGQHAIGDRSKRRPVVFVGVSGLRAGDAGSLAQQETDDRDQMSTACPSA
jgi:hypothetical protein